jgi:twitching motility protein PilT
VSDPFLSPGGEPSRPPAPYRGAVPMMHSTGLPMRSPLPTQHHPSEAAFENRQASHLTPDDPAMRGGQPGYGAPGGGFGQSAPPQQEVPLPAAPPIPGPGVAASGTRVGLSQHAHEGDIDLDETLRAMLALGASDLHLTVGAPPMVRLDGALMALENHGRLDPESLQRTLYAVLTQRQRETFEAELELDFAYALRGASRFRVNLYRQRDSVGAAFRVIPFEIKSLDELGLPQTVANFAGLPRGLVLVTGPTGSGKSTTLSSIIDLANRNRSDHIMTVEDPIEFLHRHKRSLINQREVGSDTHSFASALKHVLRQDPDIILVGEMRDLETISVALTAAETGHLVFATLHTQDAAQTIDRVIDVFPAHQQDQVRTQLASALQGVVCQTLCKRANVPGRVVAAEVLIATPAIRNLIREGKTHQIYSAMQAGAAQGMHTMDQHLAELVRANKITYEVALEVCHHVEDFNRLVGRTSRMAQGAGSMGDPMNSGRPPVDAGPMPPLGSTLLTAPFGQQAPYRPPAGSGTFR